MGEIADDDFDRMMDAAGNLGRGDDWGEEWDYTNPHAPRIFACTRCGKRGLMWGMTATGWRPYDENGIHNCTSTDDFDILE